MQPNVRSVHTERARSMSRRAETVDWATDIYQDLSSGAVRAWLAAKPGRKAAGILPVYAPPEVVWANGMLPAAIWGGGDRIEIIKGDAFYQSYICHLPRSVIELAQSGRLDWASAMLFPSTCDVIRNLSGIWSMLYPSVYVRYLDAPQVLEPATGGAFWPGELRALIPDLYRLRMEQPWRVPSAELYILLRAGELVPPDLFCVKARAYLA